MPRHIHPETVTQFFELHEIPTPETLPLWRKAIAPALDLGFRVMREKEDEILVITPERHRKIYKGFGKAKYRLGMVLMHAMLSNRLH